MNAQSLIEAAQRYCSEGNQLKAIDMYTRALSKLQTSFIYNERALLYLECGESNKAVIDLTDAIALDDADSDLYLNRGNAYLSCNAFEAAIDDYNTAITMSPNETRAFNSRGWANRELGRFEDAIKDFEHAIRLEPTYVSPVFNLGLLHYERANFGEALRCFNKAFQMQPHDCAILCARGDLFVARRDFHAALGDFDAACSINDASCEAHERLARLLSTCIEPSCRNGAKALVHAVRSCQLTSWEDAECLETLAAAHAECGQFDDAQRWQSKAVLLKPEIVRDLAVERLRKYQERQPYRE